MRVSVMRVGKMRVLVRQRLMAVPVGVFFLTEAMLMGVVLVVFIFVLMLQACQPARDLRPACW